MPSGSEQRSLFVADCPRCGHLKTTFEILAATHVRHRDYRDEFECFLLCRSCARPSNALLRANSGSAAPPAGNRGEYANYAYSLSHWVFEIPHSRQVPDHVAEDVRRIFNEAADCLAIGAYDAAGTMFRKALDTATRERTPDPDSNATPKVPNWKTYKDLRLRLDWLFSNSLLDDSLRDLSSCIHQDGNDAAHDPRGIGMEEAEDLADFADQVLRVIYTIPGQIRENMRRRDVRRGIEKTDDTTAT